MTRGMGRVEEHKFRFIRVDAKPNTGEPLSTKGSEMPKLSNDARKSLTSCEDVTVIYIEGEVGITRAAEIKLKKRGGKNSREDGR